VGSTHKRSFIVSLGSAGLKSSTKDIWLLKKLNSVYGDALNYNFVNRTIAVQKGVFGLDCVEYANEETLLLDSCSIAYIKLGAPSVWDCCNINFHYKVPCNCVPVPSIHRVTVRVNQQCAAANRIKGNPPKTKFCKRVSADMIDRVPCRALPCKLA
jgi:hypothetical protein